MKTLTKSIQRKQQGESIHSLRRDKLELLEALRKAVNVLETRKASRAVLHPLYKTLNRIVNRQENDQMTMTKQTKHTPGPWSIEDGNAIKGNDGFCTVAISHGPTGEWGNIKAEHEANARLIAAAPELLEALNDLIKFCESDNTFKKTQRGIKQLIEAKQAIAKAEGGK